MRPAFFVLALLPFAAGCGARTSDTAGSDDVSDVATSRVSIRVGKKPLFVGEGTLDFAGDRGELSMSSGPGGPAIPGGRMQVRLFGRTGYTGWTFSGRTSWQKESDTATTGSDRFIPGLGGGKPQDLLSALTKSSKTIEKLEDEKIRGVSATHYRFEPKSLDEDLPQGANAVVDAWFDQAGVVRRVSVPDPEGPIVADYFDFGVEVDVEAPPADQVISEDEFSKLIEKWCKEQPSERQTLFCGFTAEDSGSGSDPGPTETVPAP